MSEFGARVRELRKAKGHTLRSLAPLVGVGFTYLSKIESGKLDFGDAPSVDLIVRIAEALDADPDDLILSAGRIPRSIQNRIFEQPDVFRQLVRCQHDKLQRFADSIQ